MRRPVILLALSILFLLVDSTNAPVVAKRSDNGSADKQNEDCASWSDAERYVIEQLRAGKPADLSIKYPENTENRILRGCFLVQLLTNHDDEFKIHAQGIVIDNAEIKGEIELKGGQIASEVKFTHCKFDDIFDFSQSTFARDLLLTRSIFDNRFDLENVSVGFNFGAIDCHFLYKGEAAFLKSMKVGGDLLLNKSEFPSGVDLTETQISGNLIADSARFSGEADFDTVRTKADCSLRNSQFGARASFTEAEFANLFLTDCAFTRSEDPLVDVDFRGLTVRSAYLDNATWGDARVSIETMKFDYISPASWDELKRLARDNSDVQFYSSLEAMLTLHGYPDQAKQAFFAQKEQERADMLRRSRWEGNKMSWASARLSWVVDIFEEYLAGYGRSLQFLLMWSVVFFLPGYFTFRKRTGMKLRKPEEDLLDEKDRPKYRPFWYCLDLFLPIVKLGDADTWIPKDDRRWALHYRRVHILIGNLLVPVGLAAWTGIIK